MYIKLFIVTMFFLTISGCSSIVSHSKYPVLFESKPTNANFVLTNKNGEVIKRGSTPTTITLKAGASFYKGETYTLTLNKQGYAEKTIEIDSGYDPWYLGNILIISYLGMFFVDPYTGAMFTLPDQSFTALEPIGGSAQ